MSWHKLSIEKGTQVAKIALSDLDRLDKDVQLCSVLYDKPIDFFESITINELYKKWVPGTKWVETLPVHRNKPFVYGKFLYKFKTSSDQLSAAEFGLLQEYNKEAEADGKTLHKTLAILTTKYNRFTGKRVKVADPLKEIELKAEIFLNHMSYGIAYSYAVFFSAYYPIFLEVGRLYFQGAARHLRELETSPTFGLRLQENTSQEPPTK